MAVELGLDLANHSSAAAIVDAIESKLGKVAEEECARWFSISVLRHLCTVTKEARSKFRLLGFASCKKIETGK